MTDLSCCVETWDAAQSHVEELIATATNGIVAHVRQYLDKVITLRNRALGMAQHRGSIPVHTVSGA
jgi:hypothetical protein